MLYLPKSTKPTNYTVFFMKLIITFSIFFLFSFSKLFADNYIKIIPDSSNRYAMIEIARNRAANYTIVFQNEKKVVMYKSVEMIQSTPKIISIDWQNFNPGFYYMIAKNKRETIKLLFEKK